MLTVGELVRAVGIPAIVATIIALLGRRRQWTWAMPLAAGAGFLVGYALLGVPKFPPRDGTDWLFWLALPITLLGVADAIFGQRWMWIFGAVAGLVALVVLRPLVPVSISLAQWWMVTIGLATAGAGITFLMQAIEPRISTGAIVWGLCIALGATGIMVMSSNLRAVGTYGIAASAAFGPVALFGGKLRESRSVTLVAIPLLAGLLAGGHYYPDPGVPWPAFITLMLSPLLLIIGALVPTSKIWVRGMVGIFAVMLGVSVVTAPAAIAAKKAAEADMSDPYK